MGDNHVRALPPLGTDRDNVHDAMRKGRHQSPDNPLYQRGSQGKSAVLNEEIVKGMRERRAKGETVSEIAASVGVFVETCRHAINRRTWRHVA